MAVPAATGFSISDLERASLQEELASGLGGNTVTATHVADNTVTNASEPVLLANALRKEAYIQNTTASGNVRITIDGSAATSSVGLQLGPGQLLVLQGEAVPLGAINAIREGGTDVTVAVVEVT